ncbi:DNA-processing protein DprA, partial [Yersinia enterocolitica]
KNRAEVEKSTVNSIDFYQLFTTELQRLAKSPATVDELIESTGLHKTQLNDWLKRAEENGVVKKLSHPVRYQVQEKQ